MQLVLTKSQKDPGFNSLKNKSKCQERIPFHTVTLSLVSGDKEVFKVTSDTIIQMHSENELQEKK